jgi:hypothetical protein
MLSIVFTESHPRTLGSKNACERGETSVDCNLRGINRYHSVECSSTSDQRGSAVLAANAPVWFQGSERMQFR